MAEKMPEKVRKALEEHEKRVAELKRKSVEAGAKVKDAKREARELLEETESEFSGLGKIIGKSERRKGKEKEEKK